MSRSTTFSLHLTREQLLDYYRGQVRFVQVRDDAGRSIRFPLSSLRPFVNTDGINGRFQLDFDTDNRLIGLRRLR